MIDNKNIDITPETKVGALLDDYPQLEERLIELAPPFAKLRNPILRKTVARVTTLRQAAKVGGINISELINSLCKEAGLSDYNSTDTNTEQSSKEKPDWFDPINIVNSLDVRQMIENGEQPLGEVMKQLRELEHHQIYELITPFMPAPLIDMAKEKGYATWSENMESDIIKTYFCSTDN